MTNPDPINRPRRPIRMVQDPPRAWSEIDFDVEWGAHGLVLRHTTCGHVVSSQHGKSANLSALVTSTLSHECPELAPVAPPECDCAREEGQKHKHTCAWGQHHLAEEAGLKIHAQRPPTWQAP